MSPKTFFAITIIVVGAAAFAYAGDEVYTGEQISLELADADLETVLVNFSQMTGFVFTIGPQTAAQGSLDQQVTALYELTPWDQVVDEILMEAGLEWTLEGRVLWIHLPGDGPTGDRNFTGDQIKLRLKDADIRDVMASFSKITGYTIELSPKIQDTVTVSLDKIPWDQVLDFILTIGGLGYELEGDIMSVYPVTDARGRQLMDPPA